MAVAVDWSGVLPVPQDRIDAQSEADGVVTAVRVGGWKGSGVAQPHVFA